MTLRVLHLSDFHVGLSSDPRSYLRDSHGWQRVLLGDPSFLGEADLLIEALKARYAKEPVDVLVVTGDIGHFARSEDQQLGLAVLEALKNAGVAASVASIGVPVLPGNHDRYAECGPHPAAAEAFDGAFRQYWGAGRGVSEWVLSSSPRLVGIGADVTFDPAECELPVPLTVVEAAKDRQKVMRLFGGGRVYRSVVDDLVNATNRCRVAGYPAIWLLHFAPQHPNLLSPGSWLDKYLSLEEESLLLSAARSCGVSVILCGHVHRSTHYRSHGITIVSAGRALACDREKGREAVEIHLDVGPAGVQVSRCLALRRTRRGDRVVEVEMPLEQDLPGAESRSMAG